ncbi:MAG: hypothetical protein IJS39_08485 [Synergistaceae bacterium]|nr:hypothetical protein [Synergistaceae bacterium]
MTYDEFSYMLRKNPVIDFAAKMLAFPYFALEYVRSDISAKRRKRGRGLMNPTCGSKA